MADREETIRELLEASRLRENRSATSNLVAPVMPHTTPHIVERRSALYNALTPAYRAGSTCPEPKQPFGRCRLLCMALLRQHSSSPWRTSFDKLLSILGRVPLSRCTIDRPAGATLLCCNLLFTQLFNVKPQNFLTFYARSRTATGARY